LMDIIVRERSMQDDFGMIPAKLRHYYKCAGCGSDGKVGTKQAKPMLTCPHCFVTYFCSEQHFNLNMETHLNPTMASQIEGCGSTEEVIKRLKAKFDASYTNKDGVRYFVEKHPEIDTKERKERLQDLYEQQMEKINASWNKTKLSTDDPDF